MKTTTTTTRRNVLATIAAMAAGLALIPLALGGGKSGSEIQTPMAIVILCGLTTSTLLNMVVVPSLYLQYAKPGARSILTASQLGSRSGLAGPR